MWIKVAAVIKPLSGPLTFAYNLGDLRQGKPRSQHNIEYRRQEPGGILAPLHPPVAGFRSGRGCAGNSRRVVHPLSPPSPVGSNMALPFLFPNFKHDNRQITRQNRTFSKIPSNERYALQNGRDGWAGRQVQRDGTELPGVRLKEGAAGPAARRDNLVTRS